MNSNLIPLFSNLDTEESSSVKEILDRLDEGQQEQFAALYLNKRRETSLILICILAGFFRLCWLTSIYHRSNWAWSSVFFYGRISFDWNNY